MSRYSLRVEQVLVFSMWFPWIQLNLKKKTMELRNREDKFDNRLNSNAQPQSSFVVQ
jgi:hypothetical protein